MSVAFKLPLFGQFAVTLNAGGVETRTAEDFGTTSPLTAKSLRSCVPWLLRRYARKDGSTVMASEAKPSRGRRTRAFALGLAALRPASGEACPAPWLPRPAAPGWPRRYAPRHDGRPAGTLTAFNTVAPPLRPSPKVARLRVQGALTPAIRRGPGGHQFGGASCHLCGNGKTAPDPRGGHMLKRSVVVVAAMIVALQPAGGVSGSLCPSCGLSATGAGSRDRLVVAGGGGMRLNGGGMGGGMTGGGGGMGGGGGGGMGGGGGIAGGGDPMGPGGFGAPRANCPDHRSKPASRHAGQNSPRTDSASTSCANSQ